MGIRVILLSAAALAFATGCYIETLDDRAPGAAGDVNKGVTKPEDPAAGNCHYAIGKGCFDGHVIAKKEFFIDGKQFFNADDLTTRFKELVVVNGPDGIALTAGKDYELQLTTAMDNQSFVSGFEYYLTGETTRSGKMRNTGNFSVNDLPEGTYDLRVQRSVKFNVVSETTRIPDAQPGDTVPRDPVTTPVVKSYCATLYADSVVDVRKGKRLWDTFGDFRLHVTDNECAAGGNRTALTLTP